VRVVIVVVMAHEQFEFEWAFGRLNNLLKDSICNVTRDTDL